MKKQIKKVMSAGLVLLMTITLFMPKTQALAAEEIEPAPVQLPFGLYEISSVLDDNYCLDIVGASQADKANLQLYEKNGTNAQKFWLKPIEGEEGLYTIINASSAKVLDVNGNSKENGANVQQYTANGTAAQKFRLIENPDGSYRIQGVGSERFLSVAGESAGNTVNIHMFRDDTVEAKAEAVEPEEEVAVEEPEKAAETVISEENAGAVELEADTEQFSEEENSELAEADENTLITQSAGDIEGTEEAEDAPAGEMADDEEPMQDGTDILTTAGTDEESTPQEEGDEPIEEEETVPANQCWIITKTEYQMPAEGLYEVTSALNQNYCLDVSGASLANSANVQLYGRNGTNAQKFYLKYLDKKENLVTLTNASSAKLLDAKNNGKANGTNIHQYERNSTAAQIFRLVPSENGGIMLEGQGSGKYVDVNSARVANGTNIQLFEGNNTAAQRWVFKATGYKFPSVARGKNVTNTAVADYMLIVPKGNTGLTVQPSAESSQSGIVLGGATNGTKDKWTMRELGGGRYEFVNVATGCALDDKNASMADANQMWLYGINGTASQSWMPEDTGDGDGSFYLVCRQSGKYLDIRGANLKAGTAVQQYTGNATIAQKFYLRKVSGIANGVHKIGGKPCYIQNNVVNTNAASARVRAYIRAAEYVDRITKPNMSMEEKLRTCFWSFGPNFTERNPWIPHYTGMDWPEKYTNHLFDTKVGNCMSFGAAFAFMAKAIGYENVYACNSGGHGWAEINGRVYDPEWAKHHKDYDYFGLSYDYGGPQGYKGAIASGKPWMRIKI